MLDTPDPAALPASPAPLAEQALPASSPFALPPISADDPCGPDLDLEGDAGFLNFVAATEGLLPPKPKDYYDLKEGRREPIDFPAQLGAGDQLLKRTLDARLLALIARFSVLSRDLQGFARAVGSLAWALGEHWEGLHPRGDGGDYSFRLSQIETLDDTASVLLPLQYATLLESARDGALSYRDQLVATGAEKPRSVTVFNAATGEEETTVPESFMPPKTIERLLKTIEVEKLVGSFEALRGLKASLESIRATTEARLGAGHAPQLPKLEKLVAAMTEFMRASLFARDPTLAPAAELTKEERAAAADDAAETAALPGGPPAFASRAEVDAALGSALGYFAASEPTSPALLLILQARETLGKNLYEVMQLLAPPHADYARVFVGPDGAFTVPVKNLANAPSAGLEPAQSEPAPSRGAALALVDAVAQHMKRAEPSSPVPYLLERAKSLASRDFVSLLADVLPEDAIESLKRGR